MGQQAGSQAVCLCIASAGVNARFCRCPGHGCQWHTAATLIVPTILGVQCREVFGEDGLTADLPSTSARPYNRSPPRGGGSASCDRSGNPSRVALARPGATSDSTWLL